MISFTFLLAACICIFGAWAETKHKFTDYYIIVVLCAMAVLCAVCGVVTIGI